MFSKRSINCLHPLGCERNYGVITLLLLLLLLHYHCHYCFYCYYNIYWYYIIIVITLLFFQCVGRRMTLIVTNTFTTRSSIVNINGPKRTVDICVEAVLSCQVCENCRHLCGSCVIMPGMLEL